MMVHYTTVMYELIMAYNTCSVLREKLTLNMSRKMHECYPPINTLSEVTTDLVATTETGMEEEITCVPETEQDPTLLDFQKIILSFRRKSEVKISIYQK